MLSACTPAATTTTTTTQAPVTVRVAGLNGPTGIGLVKLMADSDAKTTQNAYTFSLTSTPDDIVAQVSSGQVDIAALPTNMAAILYQKTSQNIQLLAINTLGVLYILEQGDTVNSLQDLSGKEVLASGQGATPEYAITNWWPGRDPGLSYGTYNTSTRAGTLGRQRRISSCFQAFVTRF